MIYYSDIFKTDSIKAKPHLSLKQYIDACGKKYTNDLATDILPFWMENGLDRVNGGFYTCLDREGRLMDTTKSVWFQGRAGFTFAAAYNYVEKRPEWLEASKSAIDFIEKYCIDTDGRLFFEMTADGKPLRKRRYLFSDSFAAIAFSEYSIASGDESYAYKALETFKRILHYKNTPGSLPQKYTDNFRVRSHSITMILINTASRIRETIDDEVLTRQIDESIDEIKEYLMNSEVEALLETVGMNGELIDTNLGRLINPGHAIETAWFILEEARHRNMQQDLIDLGTKILDWSWKWGWDEEYGGIINFRDCKNQPCQESTHDMKFWWPQTEAVIATLYAYRMTGNEKYLLMHKKANDYMYTHFPDPEFGEWFGYLHRDGRVSQHAKGNLFKGPFHIPRMMIIARKLCSEISELV